MIYIVLHKPSWYPKTSFYVPIKVGSNKFDNILMLTDSTGNNISLKNPYYNELTALYWIFKNKTDDIKGLVHYRRYFSKSIYINKLFYKGTLLSNKKIQKYLSNYDIIVPKSLQMSNTLKYHYQQNHYIKDLDLSKQILLELQPTYKESYEFVIETNQKDFQFFYNMFIAPKNIFDDYCEWLFSILFEVEKRISFEDYDNYQKRVFGFLSERLFNVYVYHNKLKYKEVRVVNIETATISSLTLNLIVSILIKVRLYSVVKKFYHRLRG